MSTLPVPPDPVHGRRHQLRLVACRECDGSGCQNAGHCEDDNSPEMCPACLGTAKQLICADPVDDCITDLELLQNELADRRDTAILGDILRDVIWRLRDLSTGDAA